MKAVVTGVLCLFFAMSLHADNLPPQLWNIALNLNGTVFYQYYCPTNSVDPSCAGNLGMMAGDVLPPQLNTAGYDFATGLGTLSLTYNSTAAGPQYVAMLFDLEVNPIVWTQEFVDKIGNAPPGLSYQAGDLYNSEILYNFYYNSLNAELLEPGDPADGSVAIGWNFDLGVDDTATLTYNVSPTNPNTSFAIDQWKVHSPRTDAFFSTSLNIERGSAPEPVTVPEPGSIGMMATGLIGAWLIARRKR